MSYMFSTICGACVMGLAKETTDYRFAFFFGAIIAGFAAVASAASGL